MNDVISVISGILLMILILLMAYGASRFLGRQMRGVGRGKYMEVLDHLPLGADRELLIVRLSREQKCLLISSGSDGARLIKELEYEYPEENGMSQGEFGEALRTALKSIGSRREKK